MSKTHLIDDVGLTKAQKWYRNNKARHYAAVKKSKQKNLRKYLHTSARNNVKKTGKLFEIDEEDLVIPERCPVFGTQFEIGTRYAASIDRIDPSKGYIKGNVQIISRLANLMKQDATEEELKQFARWVLANE